MLTDKQYERIGRYLDGGDLALTETERTVAEEIRLEERRVGRLLDVGLPSGAFQGAHQHVLMAEIRRDEAALAPLLDADVPREAMERAWRRVVAALARPQRRLMRIGTAAAAVAAAAALLLAVGLLDPWLGPDEAIDVAGPTVTPVPVEVIAESVARPEDADVALLAAEIDELEADMLAAAAPPPPVDLGIEQIERALAEFWLDDILD